MKGGMEGMGGGGGGGGIKLQPSGYIVNVSLIAIFPLYMYV